MCTPDRRRRLQPVPSSIISPLQVSTAGSRTSSVPSTWCERESSPRRASRARALAAGRGSRVVGLAGSLGRDRFPGVTRSFVSFLSQRSLMTRARPSTRRRLLSSLPPRAPPGSRVLALAFALALLPPSLFAPRAGRRVLPQRLPALDALLLPASARRRGDERDPRRPDRRRLDLVHHVRRLYVARDGRELDRRGHRAAQQGT